jgi:predicted porin
MKYRSAILGLSSLVASSVSAQSSVTLYGLVDSGIRYETNAVSYGANGLPTSTGSRLGLAQGGGLMESYWGVRGIEDMGAGLKTVFQIESHFDPSGGSLSPPGGSQFELSYVGLQSSSLGQLTLGRQYNVGLQGVALTYASNYWAGSDVSVNQFKPEQTMLAGSKTSNMVEYAAQLDSVVLLAQYALGGQAGSLSRGSQIGASLAYLPEKGTVKASATFLRNRDDVTNAKFDIFTFGGQVHYGGLIANAGYFENRRDNNFTSFGNGPFSPIDLAALGIISPAQTVDPDILGGFKTRRMVLAGVSYDFTPALTVALNGWWTRQSGYASSFDGSTAQYQLIAGYRLSKRTTLYSEVDYSRYNGGMIGAQFVGINGQSPTVSPSQTGIMAGIRHSF